MGLRIAILGSAPSSAKQAPFTDPAWKIWACSPANLQQFTKDQLNRIDLWFEMHSWSLDQKQQQNPIYWSFLRQRKKPIVMQQHDPRFPNSVPYPLAEVKKRWPWPARYNLTSSPAEMLAMALLYKPEVIGLWGIDMATGTEWAGQRQGMVRWAEIAEVEMGVRVITPGEADVLAPPPVYGFCESTHMWRKMNARKRELQGRFQACEQQRQAAHETALVLKGAIESVEYDMRTWLPQEMDEREVVPQQAVPAPAPVPPPAVQTKIEEKLKAKRNSTIVVGKKAKAKPNGKAPENHGKKRARSRGAKPGSRPSLGVGGAAPGGS